MEQYLADINDEILNKHYEYFNSIIASSTDLEARTAAIQNAEELYKEADHNKNGEIDRKEFEKLIEGYFYLKNMKPS